MVVNEVPYPGPSGPFQSCAAFNTQSAAVEIHWGEVTAVLSGAFGATATQLQDRTPPSIPRANVSNYITGTTLTDWVTAMDGTTGNTSKDLWFDPWYKFRAGTTITPVDPNIVPNPQPYPYVPVPPDIESDNSNLIHVSPPLCPNFSYQTWKNVAISGGQNIHYMVYAGSADSWKEDGVGTAQDLGDWTNGQEGFWFFDTTDQLQPDPNGTNLTPDISLSGTWSSSGFIYLNGGWQSTGIAAGSGANRVIIPPGEPWTDANGDGIADADEYTNLEYPTALNGQFTVWVPGSVAAGQTNTVTTTNGITYTNTTDPNAYDENGIPFTDTIAFQGVIYVEGRFEAAGNMTIFGSIVT